jgi:ppGpp synthetase/RelA/SpoT-type nucleotidyltranferase
MSDRPRQNRNRPVLPAKGELRAVYDSAFGRNKPHDFTRDKPVAFLIYSGMAWTIPEYSHSKVDHAGEILVDTSTRPVKMFHALEVYEESLEIINNWRSSHSLPLQIMKMTLLKRARSINEQALIAQRIKRIPAISLKLKQNSRMKLSKMHDIGGCRAVVRTVSEVQQLLNVYEEANKTNARCCGEFVKIYNYIVAPKESGYRSIHLVYRYRTTSQRLIKYNGLRIEIQLRSKIQHAWATAVETVDAFTDQALKSNIGKDSWKRFFAVVSSAFALMEKCPMVPGTPADIIQLKQELKTFTQELTLLEGFQKATETIQSKEGHIFLLQLDTEKRNLKLRGYQQDFLSFAQQEYLNVERQNKDKPYIQTVLVSVDSFKALRKAYPNYFLDISEFVKLIKGLIDS